jgi:hypothetical protein
MTTADLRVSDVSPDTPLRLDVAARLAFPDGSMTGRGLRREASRGRLAIERVAGKHYTTLRAILDMRTQCRVAPHHGYGTGGLASTVPDARAAVARAQAAIDSLA